MTETDATRRPMAIPEKFLSYLDKYRIYRMFKDILQDLIVALPRDHLKHMKMFLNNHLNSTKDTDRVVILISPELNIDAKRIVKDIVKDLGFYVITRRTVLDKYEAHDDYEPGCISPVLLSQVTKSLTVKEAVALAGWIMFDHPCTVREARCLQQDGVLPTVTLVLIPTPPVATSAENTATPPRGFFQQDFEGLKFAYKATLKEILVEPDDSMEKIATKCFNGIKACAAGAQGPGQGFNVVGAPSVYRVLLIAPPFGADRKTHAIRLAKHLGLVYLDLDYIYNQAKAMHDEIGDKLRAHGGLTAQAKAEIVRRRLKEKDALERGWVLTGYPISAVEFENIELMDSCPNRIIVLNVDWEICKQRALNFGVDSCTGERGENWGPNPPPTVVLHPGRTAKQIEDELEDYFTEGLAELRAAAGITAVEINTTNDTLDGNAPPEEAQVKLEAAVIMAPAFDIISGNQLRNVQGE